jgi:Ca2+-binding EF-hand superfamily protein
MKAFSSLIIAGCLVCAAPLAQACDPRHHGEHDGMCMEMDKNGDGFVSKKEFDAFHNEHFKALDVNKDGKLSKEELEGAPAAHEKRTTKDGRDPFDKRFEESDINHDGALSRDECEIGMPMLFGHFDEFDANKDGKITKQEVMDSMKKMHDKSESKPDEGMMKREAK